MIYHKLSWIDLEKDTLSLARKIQKKKIAFDKIIAIARGGLKTSFISNFWVKKDVVTFEFKKGLSLLEGTVPLQ